MYLTWDNGTKNNINHLLYEDKNDSDYASPDRQWLSYSWTDFSYVAFPVPDNNKGVFKIVLDDPSS